MAYERLEDGIFWISFEDFVKHFSFVYGCMFFDRNWHQDKFRGRWREGFDGGCTNHSTYPHNPHYVMEVKAKSANVFILLVQSKDRLAAGIPRP